MTKEKKSCQLMIFYVGVNDFKLKLCVGVILESILNLPYPNFSELKV